MGELWAARIGQTDLEMRKKQVFTAEDAKVTHEERKAFTLLRVHCGILRALRGKAFSLLEV